MSTPSERAQTRHHNRIEAEIDARGAIDPSTWHTIQSMEAEEAALQRQLHTSEITQDDFDDHGSSLLQTTSPVVLKATMERQDNVKKALIV